jgi:membrane dipeptidase
VIVDGHNDLLLRLWLGEEPRHLELERARAEGFAGGFFAVFVPGEPLPEQPPPIPYSLPLPPPLDRAEARRSAIEIAAGLERLDVTLARSTADFGAGHVTAILHLEGADPLAPDLSDLDEWYERGVRSIGLVWSRPNAFAHGVPFAFPGSPDTGPGLTDAGRALVRGCNERGILVDCSHLNRRGFLDVAEATDAPVVATHSNAHALCASTRNLDDEQLDVVRATGGVVGVNFAVTFVRADGELDADTPVAALCDHVDHLVERMGIDHVAFGSDYEGATVPAALADAATGFPLVVETLRGRGYDGDALAGITHRNWLRVLDATWKPALIATATARFPA